ncbi:MAG TPA: choice-of-anchor tandem repeat GloVer-containing protein [Stellaceae bacterium]|nr:choice-of-anchor tandem repeat GloVer-containing protein [Stellaceae bacterium]
MFEILRTRNGLAASPTDLVKFLGTNGAVLEAGLIADSLGNLFGTTAGGGTNNMSAVFEIKKTSADFAAAPAVRADFDGANGSDPQAGLIADRHGDLFGTTAGGGAHFSGTVFELRKKSRGFARVPTVLYSFCTQPNCIEGIRPEADLIADADGQPLRHDSFRRSEQSGHGVRNRQDGIAASPPLRPSSTASARNPIAPTAHNPRSGSSPTPTATSSARQFPAVRTIRARYSRSPDA